MHKLRQAAQTTVQAYKDAPASIAWGVGNLKKTSKAIGASIAAVPRNRATTRKIHNRIALENHFKKYPKAYEAVKQWEKSK